MPEKAERCPWCGSKISHDKFLEIQTAIREQEQRKLAAAVDLVKAQLVKERKKEIAEMRQILQKDRESALAKREAEFAREREALQKKIVEISRRVSKLREMPRSSTRSSKRRTSRNRSRMMRGDHQSPINSRLRANEQRIPAKLVRSMRR